MMALQKKKQDEVPNIFNDSYNGSDDDSIDHAAKHHLSDTNTQT